MVVIPIKSVSDTGREFLARRPFQSNNTTCDGTTLMLHGSPIAWWEGDVVCMTLAGWPTVTTRQRLNSICGELFGAAWFRRYQGREYFGERVIGDKEVIKVHLVLGSRPGKIFLADWERAVA